MQQLFTVSDQESHERLDTFLSTKLSNLSRSQISNAIKSGEITLNNEIVKSGYTIKADDVISVNLTSQRKKTDKMPVIYEDTDVIVVDKPSGMLVHSKGVFNDEFTVADFISNKLLGLSGNRAGIVHRLDRGTSGIMIAAKNQQALDFLQKQFSSRKVKKTYVAVIKGSLDPVKAKIEVPIERDPLNPKQYRVGKNGKYAETSYITLNKGKTYSLIELSPKTGRTHQLRVHLAYLKHPIIGDQFYNGEPYNRLMLHAKNLEITLPNKERKIFESPLPSEFNDIIKE
jgi:23S rRNA pseudouridine1911/1915/1917 synthase